MKKICNLAELVRGIAVLPRKDWDGFVSHLSRAIQQTLLDHWEAWAHAGQYPDDDGNWRTWLIRAGRGYGKTRAGAEWVSSIARRNGYARIALVGATLEDVRRVMVEGESGLLSVARAGENPRWCADQGELHFDSGAIAYAYSAASHEKLRGPQHHFAWCDEIGKWRDGEACWSNMMLGMRLGDAPRVLATTTPRPTPLLHMLAKRDDVVTCTGATWANRNLSPAYVDAVRALYDNTRIGRQELEGELLSEAEGALWSRDLLERQRAGKLPEMRRIVVAVDPPASAGGTCGIVAAGQGADGRAYVLADCSVTGRSPEGWARAVANAAVQWGADRVVAEGNQGGDMVLSTLRAAAIDLPVRKTFARTGKVARAEPVAALYEAGRALHAGLFPELEEQLCGMMVAGEYEGPGRSPDRADALVWAMSELMLTTRKGEPSIRLLGWAV